MEGKGRDGTWYPRDWSSICCSKTDLLHNLREIFTAKGTEAMLPAGRLQWPGQKKYISALQHLPCRYTQEEAVIHFQMYQHKHSSCNSMWKSFRLECGTFQPRPTLQLILMETRTLEKAGTQVGHTGWKTTTSLVVFWIPVFYECIYYCIEAWLHTFAFET